MSLYWNQELTHLQVTTDLLGSSDSNLTLVQNNTVDRLNEIPTCKTIYIKHVNGFPVEMTLAEKIVADANFLLKTKEAKIEEIKSEAQRRVIEENNGNEIGIGFIHMTDHDQRNALALCLDTIKQALDIIHGFDILTVLPQEKQDAFNGIYHAWGLIVTIRALSDLIEVDVNSATTVEEVEAIPVESNPKWII